MEAWVHTRSQSFWGKVWKRFALRAAGRRFEVGRDWALKSTESGNLAAGCGHLGKLVCWWRSG